MRPCTFYTDDVGEVCNGFFHQWGKREEFNSSFGNSIEITVGIVEDKKSGKVYTIAPDKIRFTDNREMESV